MRNFLLAMLIALLLAPALCAQDDNKLVEDAGKLIERIGKRPEKAWDYAYALRRMATADGGSVLALGLSSLVYILASLGLGLFISTVSRTQQEAFMGMFLLLLPAVILSGFMYPVHTMPEFFQLISTLNPLRHFLEIVRGVFLKGDDLLDLWRQFLVLTAMAAGILFFATWRFQRSMR